MTPPPFDKLEDLEAGDCARLAILVAVILAAGVGVAALLIAAALLVAG